MPPNLDNDMCKVLVHAKLHCPDDDKRKFGMSDQRGGFICVDADDDGLIHSFKWDCHGLTSGHNPPIGSQ